MEFLVDQEEALESGDFLDLEYIGLVFLQEIQVLVVELLVLVLVSVDFLDLGFLDCMDLMEVQDSLEESEHQYQYQQDIVECL